MSSQTRIARTRASSGTKTSFESGVCVCLVSCICVSCKCRVIGVFHGEGGSLAFPPMKNILQLGRSLLSNELLVQDNLVCTCWNLYKSY